MQAWTRGWLFGAALCLIGCNNQTQLQADNIPLLRSITTAVNSRNSDWVAEHRSKTEAKVKEGSMTPAERAAFEPIYEAARLHDWAKAQRLAQELAKGQQSRVAKVTPVKPERRDPPVTAGQPSR